jgi:hypothetical protein
MKEDLYSIPEPKECSFDDGKNEKIKIIDSEKSNNQTFIEVHSLINSPSRKTSLLFNKIKNIFTKNKQEAYLEGFTQDYQGEIWKHVKVRAKDKNKSIIQGFVKVSELISNNLVYDSKNQLLTKVKPHIEHSSQKMNPKEVSLEYKKMEQLLDKKKSLLHKSMMKIFGDEPLTALKEALAHEEPFEYLEEFIHHYKFLGSCLENPQNTYHFLNDYHFAPGLKAECLKRLFESIDDQTPEKKIYQFICNQKLSNPKVRTLQIAEYFKLLNSHPVKAFKYKFQTMQLNVLLHHNKRRRSQCARLFKTELWEGLHIKAMAPQKLPGFSELSPFAIQALQSQTPTKQELEKLGSELQKNTLFPSFFYGFLTYPQPAPFIKEEIEQISDVQKTKELHKVWEKYKDDLELNDSFQKELSVLFGVMEIRRSLTYNEFSKTLCKLFDLLYLHSFLVKRELKKIM